MGRSRDGRIAGMIPASVWTDRRPCSPLDSAGMLRPVAEDVAQIRMSEEAEGIDVFWYPPLPASASDCIARLPDGSERKPEELGDDDRFGFRSLPAGTQILRGGDVLYTVAERR